MSAAYESVRKLAPADSTEGFDCGQLPLNQFLQRYALVNQKANSSQTYVSCLGAEVDRFRRRRFRT